MSKIHFTSVEGEGFRTLIKPFRFNLDRPGLNLMKGVNGSGKTSLFETIVWTLYGITLKDTNIGSVATWEENRPSTWQGTRTSVVFRKDRNVYCVTRHLNYKGKTYDVKGEDSLMLAKGDDDRGEKVTLLGNFRDKAAIQEEINRILGIDAKTFLNSVLFGQRLAKLIESDNGDKRKLFETLFETEWVNVAKAKCDADLKKLELEIAIKSQEIQNLESTIEQKKIRLTQAQQMLQGFEENRAKRLEDKILDESLINSGLITLKENIKALEEELSAIKYDSEEHDKVEADYNATKDLINQAKVSKAQREAQKQQDQNKLIYLEKDVTRTQENLKKKEAVKIGGNCPYCAQELKEGNKLELTHKKEIAFLKAEHRAAKTAYEAFRKEITDKSYATQVEISSDQLDKGFAELTNKLTKLAELEKQYNAVWDKIDTQKHKEEQAKRDLARIDNEIEAIEAEQPPKIDVKGIENEIEADKEHLLEEQVFKIELEKQLDIARWRSTKAFSSGGIKAFIFKAMLGQLNQNVKKYGQRLGVSLEFSIDLTKASKPFTTNCSIGSKMNKDYRDFSGGEKQRLDICLMLGMYDLISMGTDINILVMDEALENLDEEGETAIFELIRGKAQEGKSIYLISHSAVLDSLYSNTIQFEKDNNGNTIITE